MRDIDAYEEELALVDLSGRKHVKVVEFCEDSTYQFRVDEEGTKGCVCSFFDGCSHALYEGRTYIDSEEIYTRAN